VFVPDFDADERFKIETDDPEDALRRLLAGDPPDEEDSTEAEDS